MEVDGEARAAVEEDGDGVEEAEEEAMDGVFLLGAEAEAVDGACLLQVLQGLGTLHHGWAAGSGQQRLSSRRRLSLLQTTRQVFNVRRKVFSQS